MELKVSYKEFHDSLFIFEGNALKPLSLKINAFIVCTIPIVTYFYVQ